MRKKVKEVNEDGSEAKDDDVEEELPPNQDIGIESKFQRHILANFDKQAIILSSRVHPG